MGHSEPSGRVCKGCIKGVQISLRCSGFVLQERTNSAVQTAGPSEFERTFYSPQRQTDSDGQNDNLALDPSRVDLALHIQPRRHVGYCSPRCPVAHGKLLTPGARWCPRRVPPPIACCAGTAELHGAGQGSATEALSRSDEQLNTTQSYYAVRCWHRSNLPVHSMFISCQRYMICSEIGYIAAILAPISVYS